MLVYRIMQVRGMTACGVFSTADGEQRWTMALQILTARPHVLLQVMKAGKGTPAYLLISSVFKPAAGEGIYAGGLKMHKAATKESDGDCV